MWWLQRAVMAMGVIFVVLGAGWLWLYWGWATEDKALREVGQSRNLLPYFGEPGCVEPLGGEELKSRLGAAGWVLDRVRKLSVSGNREVQIDGMPVHLDPVDLSYVGKFKYLTYFSFCDSELSDAALAFIGGQRRLECLILEKDPHVTGEGLGLQNLKSLVVLKCEQTPINDAALSQLKDLTHLEDIDLIQTNITDAGLEHLKDLKNLQNLHLAETKITGAGFVHFKNLSHLTTLDADHTQVADAGLVHLRGLANLETLDLGETRITDAGLAHIAEIKSLRTLFISGTQITEKVSQP